MNQTRALVHAAEVDVALASLHTGAQPCAEGDPPVRGLRSPLFEAYALRWLGVGAAGLGHVQQARAELESGLRLAVLVDARRLEASIRRDLSDLVAAGTGGQ